MSPEIIREIRINPIIPAESVLIATARGSRPLEKLPTSFLDRREIVAECHFCRGNEHSLPYSNLGIHHVIDG